MKKINRILIFIALVFLLVFLSLEIVFNIRDRIKPKEAEISTFTIKPHHYVRRYVIRQGSAFDTIYADRFDIYGSTRKGYIRFMVDEQCVGVVYYSDKAENHPVVWTKIKTTYE
jgi:hypothetical protein